MTTLPTLVDLALAHAQRTPDKPFVVIWRSGGAIPFTYAELVVRAREIAARLQSAGVQVGELVAISHETSPDIYAAFLGAMMIGAMPAIMPHPNAKQRDEVYWATHRQLYEKIEPKAFLLSSKLAELHKINLPELKDRFISLASVTSAPADFPAPNLDSSTIAFLQHSSGTTALKKGVILAHGAVVDHARRYAAAIGLTSQSEIVSWLPLYHDMGLIACFMTPLVMGATVTSIDPFEWVARPRLLLEAAAARRAEFAWMPNFGFAHLVNSVREPAQFDLSSLKAVINCSEPCRPSTHDRFVAHFAPAGLRPEAMQVCYAMAENVFAVSQTRLDKPAPALSIDRDAYEAQRVEPARAGGQSVQVASCGPVLPGMEVRIVDEDRVALSAGRIGEIVISSPTLFSGYNRRADLTAKALVDGYYYTNDMGFIHDNELYVTGRRDDMILAYGRNFMAHELEAVVNTVEGVRPGRAVVFGVVSDTLGTTEIAVLTELADGAEEQGVTKAVRARLEAASGVVPRHVSVLPAGALLKTTSGKISRSANRDAFLRRQADGDAAA